MSCILFLMKFGFYRILFYWGFCLDRFHGFSFTIKLVLYQKAYNTPVLKLDWPCCVWYMEVSYWDISIFFHELVATPEHKYMRSMMPTSHIKFSCSDIFHNLLVSILLIVGLLWLPILIDSFGMLDFFFFTFAYSKSCSLVYSSRQYNWNIVESGINTKPKLLEQHLSWYLFSQNCLTWHLMPKNGPNKSCRLDDVLLDKASNWQCCSGWLNKWKYNWF